ncbi:MAG TPA: SpoIIE family protein phosphatase [Bacteroidales bacterium]|nr:SpoIIE family protein phosphatase [Bacteroidales bacterium]
MFQKIIPAFLLIILLFSGANVRSQEYRIINYGITEGISYPFVYTINQDKRGFIWAGTGQGLNRFNGFVFNAENAEDSLSMQVASVSFKDSDEILWFGYQSGDLVSYNGIKFTSVNLGESVGAITSITELDNGPVIVSTQSSGLFAVDRKTGKGKKIEGISDMMINAIYAKGNILLLGTMDGMSICSVDNAGTKISVKVVVPELDLTRIQDIEPSVSKNIFWIATEDKGVFRLAVDGEKYTLLQTGASFKLESERVQSVFEDEDKNLWISSQRNGVFRLSQPDGKGNFAVITHYNKESGLAGNSARKVFQDLEGNIWVALYGDGLSMLTSQPMSFIPMDVPGLENDLQSVIAADNGLYYAGGPAGLFRFNLQKDKQPVRIKSIPAVKVTALAIDGKDLYIGTETEGLFVMNTAGETVRKVNYDAYSMGLWVSSIAISSQHVYLGTKDGIYQFGRDLVEQAHYTTTNSMPHNNIEDVMLDNNNRLLFATKTNGIYEIKEDGTVNNLYPTGSEIEFKSLTEDENGNIWAATYGDGALLFKDDSVYQFMVQNGLKADFCYSIVSDGKGSVWVGHRMGLSRINVNNLLVSVYDQHVGMSGDCNTNSVFRDRSGTVFFGTTAGLVSYDPSKDNRKPLPPFTNIVSLLIYDKPYDFSQDIVLPYKLYRMRIEFIGLNYSDPQGVRYQYKLDGYDLEWSDVTSQSFVSYPRIEDGDYTFYVRSYNGAGLSQAIPVTIHIRVLPPLWKTWWFILLVIAFLVAVVYLIIKYRERKQKQLQEYLETELTARTKEVVEQKEEIEIKNRDITDSINYAKRIQTSMLPPVKRLQQHFSGSFVFYSPRDIVSGDFYWFDKVNDNKFVIVCADSTGHGVPGAFMSMIGSTLIKDICNRESGNSPSKVLQVLDCELRNTLNQNLDDGTKPGDGMDIIVCEIDLKTHYVRFASAMRPMIIYKDGEEIFVKGSRNSVGGHYDKTDNLFEDEGLQLSKGDLIYMFSDGYSDQFGGPMGKKFKMVRLKNLLQDIHTKSMDDQCVHVKNTFNLWKENFDQVDDVLFMGIKI